ncbi:MAG: ethylbenzene dehydrogenase-related protein, partial [Gammaproteobacteria bacterium]|nr:ethylbenzene dehydrogenase-related protein [Gammaproteobacteria bacterium]
MKIATRGLFVFGLLVTAVLTACSREKSDNTGENAAGPPADTYFSLAVTDNSHNHTGAKLLFLDFQTTRDNTAIRNNVVISPQVARAAIALDGDAKDWDTASLTTIKGLPQNNYPLSEFIDAQSADMTVGSAWDEDYIYFLVQWEDAGHTASTQMNKWEYDGTTWRAKPHRGVTAGAPNANAVNRNHLLTGNEDEDRVLMMFPIIDTENNFAAGQLGCAAYCHANLKLDNPLQNYTGAGVAEMHTNRADDHADVWHWKSTRTAPSGFADDAYIGFAARAEDGHKADSGNAAYRENNQDGHPAWRHKDAAHRADDVLTEGDVEAIAEAPTAGNTLPAFISVMPSASRADVQARHRYDDVTHRWTVEFRRARMTGNSDDRQFGTNGVNATPPAVAAISNVDSVAGENSFNANCRGCHSAHGAGSTFGNAWVYPRNQRASGSLISKAVRTVGMMGGFKDLPEQEIENIAAFLQTQATFVDQRLLKVTLNGVSTAVAANAITSAPTGIDCL